MKKNKKSKEEVKFIYSEEYKTNIENPTMEELKEIFNEKYFRTIMKIEKNNFEGCINS